MYQTIVSMRELNEKHKDALRLLEACRTHPGFILRYCMDTLLQNVQAGCDVEDPITSELAFELMDWIETNADISFKSLDDHGVFLIAHYITDALMRLNQYVSFSSVNRPGQFISGFGIWRFIGNDPVIFIEYSSYGHTVPEAYRDTCQGVGDIAPSVSSVRTHGLGTDDYSASVGGLVRNPSTSPTVAR